MSSPPQPGTRYGADELASISKSYDRTLFARQPRLGSVRFITRFDRFGIRERSHTRKTELLPVVHGRLTDGLSFVKSAPFVHRDGRRQNHPRRLANAARTSNAISSSSRASTSDSEGATVGAASVRRAAFFTGAECEAPVACDG